ncbi:glycosyltransferase family 4 protein [Vibrio sp. 10N.261.51.A3]|uniref:glycosyltransferase family 4 protein n=1 Tax=Vibrio sp. 10N.261.51.A3 TaxID=3229673 RepID=UPI00354E9CA5
MKILFVESYPQVVFGQQKTLLSLLFAAKEQGIDVSVACTERGVFTEKVEQLNYNLELFPYPEMLSTYGGAIYRYGLVKKIKTAFQLVRYISGIRRELKALNPDVIFCNDMRGLLTVGVAAKLVGIPAVIWDKLDKPHGWMDWFQLPLVSKNITISDSVRVKYPQWQQSFYADRIEKIYNGAYLDVYENTFEKRAKLGLNDSDVAIAIVGSINFRKAHDRVLEIFPTLYEKNKNIKLLVVGDCSNSAEDIAYMEQLPNRDHIGIEWLGFRTDAPEIIKSIDILVIPSRYEGMGQVTVEAMASGKPVVGANNGGIPEVVENGVTGFIFEGDDLADFESKVFSLCESRALRKEMGAAGLKRAQKYFNRSEQHQKVINLLRQVGKNNE